MLPARIPPYLFIFLSRFLTFPCAHIFHRRNRVECVRNEKYINAKGKIEVEKKKSNTFCERGFLEFYCIMFYRLWREIFEMMGRSFERDNINFIQTQVRNSFSRNLKDIYIYIYRNIFYVVKNYFITTISFFETKRFFFKNH